jgi:hypothetical protein
MTFSIYYRKKQNSHLFQSLEKSELGITKLQNYIPIYERFFALNNTNHNAINLNSHSYITHYNKYINDHVINAKVAFVDSTNNSIIKNSNREIFIKYSPLLDPLKYLSGKYKDNNKFTLPTFGKKETIEKINDVNNSAYIDAFMTYLTSNLLHYNGFLHGLDFYGSFLCMKKNFEYDMIDDVEAIHNNSYFHKNNGTLFTLPENIDSNYFDNSSRNYKNRLNISDEISINSFTSFESDVLDVFKPNINVSSNKEIAICENIYEANGEIMNLHPENDDESSFSSCSTEDKEEWEDCSADEEGADEEGADEDGSDEDGSDEDGSDEDGSDDDDDEKMIVSISEFPCQAIFLEKCHNTLDNIMMEGELNEDEWISALFQVIVILYTYQKCFQMTHNDLHTNNIMYNETEKQYLYYCIDGIHYKVPTYGRIFKIIDFGRAIYKYEDKVICSDSYHHEGDAATQYNCEPYFNDKKPKLDPNMSFDLCRLACSIYDFFIDDLDEVEEMVKISPTFSIINDWIKDDKNRNILYKQNGEERYPDFKLYKMIARSVHNHSPKDQFQRPQFDSFKIAKKKINKKVQIMNIDKMPVYYK